MSEKVTEKPPLKRSRKEPNTPDVGNSAPKSNVVNLENTGETTMNPVSRETVFLSTDATMQNSKTKYAETVGAVNVILEPNNISSKVTSDSLIDKVDNSTKNKNDSVIVAKINKLLETLGPKKRDWLYLVETDHSYRLSETANLELRDLLQNYAEKKSNDPTKKDVQIWGLTARNDLNRLPLSESNAIHFEVGKWQKDQNEESINLKEQQTILDIGADDDLGF